jgi:hypothetical protein
MNNDKIPCCAADALRRIRQVPVNGIMTRITMLRKHMPGRSWKSGKRYAGMMTQAPDMKGGKK